MILEYRKAIPQDTAVCLDIRGKTSENAWSIEQLNEVGITHDMWSDGIKNDDIPGYVCLANNRIVGYCFADRESGEICVVAILPEYENLGIGKRLLQKIIYDFKGYGFKKLFLGCSADKSSRSYGFYRHLGWKFTGEMDSNNDEILELIL